MKEDKQANHMALSMGLDTFAGCAVMHILAALGQIAWDGLSVGIGLLGNMLTGTEISKK